MKCEKHNFETENKKSFSNHMRWCEGRMSRDSFRGINFGEKNGNWLGSDVSKKGLHPWVTKRMPKKELCEDCKKEPAYDLANKGTYNRDISNWQWLCRRCHMLSDGRLTQLHENHSKWLRENE